jgi:D-arabinose 1-dehydrogenase-like Zn-dependent alcohol dehydrogenase
VNLAAYKIISTSSPGNFDLIKTYGADEVVDYHDAESAVKAIRDKTGGKLAKVLDTISEGESFKICLESFAGKGERKYNALLSVSEEGKKVAEEKGIETEFTLAYTLLGNVSSFLQYLFQLSLIPCRPFGSSRDRPSSPYPRIENSTQS